MAFAISDTEFVLMKARAEAVDHLDAANDQVRVANGEIARLRRQLAAANARITQLEGENRTLGERLIGLLRRH